MMTTTLQRFASGTFLVVGLACGNGDGGTVPSPPDSLNSHAPALGGGGGAGAELVAMSVAPEVMQSRVSLSFSPNPPVLGQSVTVTATVPSNHRLPSGIGGAEYSWTGEQSNGSDEDNGIYGGIGRRLNLRHCQLLYQCTFDLDAQVLIPYPAAWARWGFVGGSPKHTGFKVNLVTATGSPRTRNYRIHRTSQPVACDMDGCTVLAPHRR